MFMFKKIIAACFHKPVQPLPLLDEIVPEEASELTVSFSGTYERIIKEESSNTIKDLNE